MISPLLDVEKLPNAQHADEHLQPSLSRSVLNKKLINKRLSLICIVLPIYCHNLECLYYRSKAEETLPGDTNQDTPHDGSATVTLQYQSPSTDFCQDEKPPNTQPGDEYLQPSLSRSV